MPVAWDKVNRHHWAKVRKTVLIRDDHTCQIQLPGCTTTATQVDHITPISEGGMLYDTNNLRASCSYCNRTRGTAPPPHTTQPEHW